MWKFAIQNLIKFAQNLFNFFSATAGPWKFFVKILKSWAKISNFAQNKMGNFRLVRKFYFVRRKFYKILNFHVNWILLNDFKFHCADGIFVKIMKIYRSIGMPDKIQKNFWNSIKLLKFYKIYWNHIPKFLNVIQKYES